MQSKTNKERLFDWTNAIFMILLVAITLYPFMHVFLASISDSNQMMSHRGLMLKPLGFSLDAYKIVLNNPNILSGYKVTLFVVFFGTFVNIVMTSLGAYILSRKNVYWNKYFMFFIVFTMFFSGGLIPTFLLVYNTLGLGDNLLALILPGAISTWNLIVMRTSFASIPESLVESVKIDGANDFTIFYRLIIPLSMPVIAVMILFYAVGHWNSWFGALIYLRDRELYPLQIILREILVLNSTDSMTTNIGGYEKVTVGETIQYATIMVTTLPILLIYPFLQKYFVKGVMIGALKE